MFHHRIEDREHLPHAGDLGGFAGGAQGFVESTNEGAPLAGYQRRHVQADRKDKPRTFYFPELRTKCIGGR